MSILNQTQIETNIATDFADNTIGSITPALARGMFTDLLESLQAYGGVMSGTAVDDVPATTTPTKVTTFTTNATSANLLLEADQANDMIAVLQSGLYRITLRFEGSWPAVEDLRLLVYVNGAPSTLTPFDFTVSGEGAGDPISLSFTSVAIIIQDADIAAGTGGTQADVALYFGSDTGDFLVDQVKVTFGLEYNPLSINTVG
jgi:hypothetical protein